MKLKNIIVSTIAALSLGLSMTSFAGYTGGNNYYPPERIHCSLDHGKLNCEGFSHQYLVEDTYTADFDDKDQTFAFKSGVAYYTPDETEATVFFTYRNSKHKLVKLRSTSTNIRPDFENGQWIKMQEDMYVCKDGYMHCPITSLPAVKK